MTTTEATTLVPQVSRLVDLQAQIRDLQRAQAEVLSTIVSDCEFMDVPAITLEGFEVDGKLEPGDVCHVALWEHEQLGRPTHRAHPSEGCDRPECFLLIDERTKWVKHAHVGKRTFVTRLVEHVVAGVEEYQDPAIRWALRKRYVLVPTKSPRPSAR